MFRALLLSAVIPGIVASEGRQLAFDKFKSDAIRFGEEAREIHDQRLCDKSMDPNKDITKGPFVLERHDGDPKHGDVCRGTKGGGFFCPSLLFNGKHCKHVPNGAPYCTMQETPGGPKVPCRGSEPDESWLKVIFPIIEKKREKQTSARAAAKKAEDDKALTKALSDLAAVESTAWCSNGIIGPDAKGIMTNCCPASCGKTCGGHACGKVGPDCCGRFKVDCADSKGAACRLPSGQVEVSKQANLLRMQVSSLRASLNISAPASAPAPAKPSPASKPSPKPAKKKTLGSMITAIEHSIVNVFNHSHHSDATKADAPTPAFLSLETEAQAEKAALTTPATVTKASLTREERLKDKARRDALREKALADRNERLAKIAAKASSGATAAGAAGAAPAAAAAAVDSTTTATQAATLAEIMNPAGLRARQ